MNICRNFAAQFDNFRRTISVFKQVRHRTIYDFWPRLNVASVALLLVHNLELTKNSMSQERHFEVLTDFSHHKIHTLPSRFNQVDTTDLYFSATEIQKIDGQQFCL